MAPNGVVARVIVFIPICVVVDGRGGVIKMRFVGGRVRGLLAVLGNSGEIDTSDLMFRYGSLAFFFD